MNRIPIPLDPPGIVQPAEDLAILAQQINAAHEAGERNALERLRHYRAAGEGLIRAKDQLARDNGGSSHGKWLPWLKKNVKVKKSHVHRLTTFAKIPSGGNLEEEEENWRLACNKQEDDETVPEYVTLDQWNEAGEEVRKKFLTVEGDSKFNSQGDSERIEWALWSWNPISGCLHDCPYCYARDMANRLYEQKFAPSIWPGRLNAPTNTTLPPEEKITQLLGHKNVFTCSMADLFGRWVPVEWIDAVLERVRAAPQWNFLFLTKFPIRLSEFEFPDNAWVGTTVDCQIRVANAERAFRKVKAKVKWLSCEPLIEPLKFSALDLFQWIVIGGASASTQTPEWRPPQDWTDDLRRAAERAGCQVYQKENWLVRRRDYPGCSTPEPVKAPAALRYLPEVEPAN